jgi:hypothetical protein
VTSRGDVLAIRDPHGRRPVECCAVRVARRTVNRLIACAACPCGVSAAVAEASAVADEGLIGPEWVAVRYLAPSAADMPIFAILLSGHVSCRPLGQTFETRRARQIGAPP